MKRNRTQWAAKAARLIMCAAAICAPLVAQQAPPSADAFTLNTTPKSNYGPSPLLAVTSGATSFIQFNLAGLPANATVSKATLRLYVDAVTGAGAFDVYEVNAPWTETSLNFTNAPPPGLSATGSKPVSISTSNSNQFVLIDITTLVQQWVNGTLINNGIALKLTSAAGGFSFDSKESPLTSHEPELEIALATAGPAGPQGPAGAAGQTGPAGPQGIPGNLNPGSQYYVQNGTTTQTGASFNIDGNGTVGGILAGSAVNSANGYQVGGKMMFNATPALENIAIGNGAGNAAATGRNNQILGNSAGVSLTTGANNLFVGSFAGSADTTGSNNIAIGTEAAYFGTTGENNTLLGSFSGFSQTTASFNTFLGNNTGPYTTTGGNNTFVGNSAGYDNTTGTNNTFVGDEVGFANTTGSGNIYIGSGSGDANSTGSNNLYMSNAGVANESNAIRLGNNQTATFLAGVYGASVASGQPVVIDGNGHLGSSPALSISGTVAGSAVNSSTGYEIGGKTIFNANPSIENITIGDSAGNAAATGGSNQIIGDRSGISLTTGNADVFMGSDAGFSTTTGNGDVFLGFQTGSYSSTGAYDTFVGAEAGSQNGAGNYNVYLGFRAGVNLIGGKNNTFLGTAAGSTNLTGSSDIYINSTGVDGENNAIRIGDPANQNSAYVAGIYRSSVASGAPVYVDSTGHLGTEIGGKAIFNANPSIENVAIGDGAGNATATGGSNQMIGDQSGSNMTTGNADVFMGSLAGRATTTGNGDVFLGFETGDNNSTGAYNTYVGGEAGFSNQVGSNNVLLGFRAGGNLNGNGNTILGTAAGILNTSGDNNIYINHSGTASESGTIRIGQNGQQTSTFLAGVYGVTSASGVPVFVNSNGQLGTQTSSRRYKEEIADMGDATEALMKLRPVTFYYKHEYDNGPRTLQYGLIAEEVAKVFPELVAYNADGSAYTVRYQFLSSMLLNEVQKQYRRSQQQEDLVQAQQEIRQLKERLERIEKILSSGSGNGNERSTNSQGN